jgi:hypothetical protein
MRRHAARPPVANRSPADESASFTSRGWRRRNHRDRLRQRVRWTFFNSVRSSRGEVGRDLDVFVLDLLLAVIVGVADGDLAVALLIVISSGAKGRPFCTRWPLTN